MMNDGMLSQDEIDALLNNTANEDPEENVEDAPAIEDYLSSLEQDALGEIGNISFGSSATTLSTLLNQKVDITTPTISVIKKSKLEDEFPHPHVGIEVKYTEGFSGVNLFVLQSSDASIIADLMLGGEGEASSEELNEIHLSAVQEAMNQMMGTAATSMSTVFSKRVDISPPAITLLDKEESEKYIPEEDVLIKVSFQLKIGSLIDSNIMQLLPVQFAKDLVNDLLNPPEQESKPEEPNETISSQPEITKHSEEKVVNSNPNPRSNQSGSNPKQLGELSQANTPIQTAEFSSFNEIDLPAKEKHNLDMLLDIPLKVTVELGRTQRTVKDILELSSGSIIELDKLAGEPVDIHVNDKLIAKGEVVVIDENFGVRVTDIVSQTDRLKKLK
ncbi:flagellar motor switch phosphatase FliY [Aquibacillus rhizosphaerae]|uniref:Flagellar motor switch phosphatase FliY n=1 Tax=Aquibacillus rhizosphaerae TaxID=3051431 RepID=A0ABT7L2I3_9BACI|nr:flagellar motor switch phosphatase FliY [Aquibacillus sp. LR5S19]MDL4840072.1 flagellar motor switch phosphatase FliY [Aquibacillus sp. LR5S19]